MKSQHQALKNAKTALEDIKRGIGEGKLKKMSEAERAREALENERVKKKAMEEKAAAEHPK